MTTTDYNQYKDSLKPVREAFSKEIQYWIAEAEKDAKNGSKYFSERKQQTVKRLQQLQSSFDQVMRVLKEEVESNESVQLAQSEEIVRLTDSCEKWSYIYSLSKVNYVMSSMIIKQDLN